MASYSIHGDIIWTERIGEIRSVENGYLTVEDGKIASVSSSRPDTEIIETGHSLIIPGLSDLHLHAPQYAFCGLYMDEELLEWLNAHTFPEEAKYKDLVYADRAYSIFADDLRKSPTTRFSAFATIHTDSAILLMKKLESAGFSGFVGKVNMDRNSPDYLSETTEESVTETERFLHEAEQFMNVKASITPRFIPSCSEPLLKTLGDIRRRDSLPLQSHLDENLSEVEWVKELCPWASSYAAAYCRFGMLGKSSVMAHCVWLDDSEIKLLSETGTYIAHAPSSNTNLSSGIAPVRKYIDAGCSVGLATDVAGGSSLSLFRIMSDAISVSKLRWRLVDEMEKPLTFREAFYLASKGGGSYFGKVGSFEAGYDADIVVLDGSPLSVLDSLAPEERLEQYVYRMAEAPVKAKFIKGRRVL